MSHYDKFREEERPGLTDKDLQQAVDDIKEFRNKDKEVNHPDHYTSHPSGIECIQVTEHMDFCIGNAIKYLWRSGIKDKETETTDLKKAIWYINRKIKLLDK